MRPRMPQVTAATMSQSTPARLAFALPESTQTPPSAIPRPIQARAETFSILNKAASATVTSGEAVVMSEPRAAPAKPVPMNCAVMESA